MLAPSLLASTPFRNRTAFNDMVGILALYHAALAQTIARNTGTGVKLLPIGNANGGDAAWLDALTKQTQSETDALGIAGPGSYSEFDLRDPSEFASFTFIVAEDLERIRKAAGLS
jgi:hypothetical protein